MDRNVYPAEVLLISVNKAAIAINTNNTVNVF